MGKVPGPNQELVEGFAERSRVRCGHSAGGRAGNGAVTLDSGTIPGWRGLLAMQDHPLIDRLYLRERAEEFRAHAKRVHDQDSKRLMLNLAKSYDNLARLAQERSDVPGDA
jgi:hypothetical protein